MKHCKMTSNMTHHITKEEEKDLELQQLIEIPFHFLRDLNDYSKEEDSDKLLLIQDLSGIKVVYRYQVGYFKDGGFISSGSIMQEVRQEPITGRIIAYADLPNVTINASMRGEQRL